MKIMVEKRKERKLTQSELGQIVGCSQRAIAGYELDERKPSVVMAQRIGAELGFPWTEFYVGKSDNVDGFEDGRA